ncbi:FMN-binding protein [Gudongella oleilytica]|uniref:FMN-binding protein n=1 Tax=Gudongella oleilytica TaxID=1582259 RepID=UPI002A35C0A0|nr:FMN-binding protein [Gudongella oleilytica]MDY0257057.1 FMN-binding protein [Gudongella oleilytica]
MKKSFLYPIVFMSLLTAIFTFILAFMEFGTAERVQQNLELELQRKILYVFNIPVVDNSAEVVNAVFEDKITQDEDVFIYKEDGQTVGYAFPAKGPGLWGGIETYVGISEDYSTILGLAIITQNETPGLGGRIGEEEFLSQFRNLDVSSAVEGGYITYRPAAGGNVDAVAGATLTSKSVSTFLNEDIHNFLAERKGE